MSTIDRMQVCNCSVEIVKKDGLFVSLMQNGEMTT